MDFLRRLTHSVLDGITTPTAPKIGRIPLPDVESMDDVKNIVVHLEGHRSTSDYSSECSSPVSPIVQKRKGSLSVSRSTTPQTRCTSRTSSSSYPHSPSIAATPHIVAPTPRRVEGMLHEDGWRRCETPPHTGRPETTRQHTEKTERTLSNPARPSRTVTPQSPPANTIHSGGRTSRPRANSTRDESHTHPELSRRRHDSSVISRPSTTAPSTGHPTERALPLERGTASRASKRPPKGILKSSTSTIPEVFTVS